MEAGGALWIWQPVTEFKGPTGKWFQKQWREPHSEPEELPGASGSEHQVAPPRHAWSGREVQHSAPRTLAAHNSRMDSGCPTSPLVRTFQGGDKPLRLIKHQDYSQV